MGQAALDARLQNGVGPRVPQGRSVLSQQVGELFTDLSVAQMEQRDREREGGQEGEEERGREMNHRCQQQSPCVLPARLHKALDQGGCCPRVHTCTHTLHPSFCTTFPPILTLGRQAQSSSPHLTYMHNCAHASRPSQCTGKQQAARTREHLLPTPAIPASHLFTSFIHTSLPSWVLEQNCNTVQSSPAKGNGKDGE